MSRQETSPERPVFQGRNVNEQLGIMKATVTRILDEGGKPQVSILGINALGPLHQGLKAHRTLLRQDGNMRVLFMDPQ